MYYTQKESDRLLKNEVKLKAIEVFKKYESLKDYENMARILIDYKLKNEDLK